jgi:preprotein translocase subunit SecB
MISPLRLDGYRIDRLTVQANADFDRRDESTGTIDVTPQHFRHKEEENVHQLELTVVFGALDGDAAGAPYLGEIVGRAFFHLQGESQDEEANARLVLLNGSAILYGLLRGQIAQVTALSHHGAFLLPPVNLVETFRAKFESESEAAAE